MILVLAAMAAPLPYTVIRPEWYGAIPDDGVDDYPGFLATVQAANEVGSNVIVELRPGEYQIDQYRRQDDPSSPEQLRFEGIDGLAIEGNGATIQSFGGFHRRNGERYASKSPDNSISLLTFSRVQDLVVSDITVLGGVESMTRAPGVAENGGNNGVSLSEVQRAVLTDVESSYWPADGFYLGAGRKVDGVYTASKDVQMRRIKAHHNRRQGLSIIQAAGVLCEDCDLSYTGSPMVYGAHNPRAGVDIEPHRRPCDHPDPGSTCVDVITGGITFVRPVMRMNRGFCLVSEDTNKVDDVTLIDAVCEVDPDTDGGSGMLLSVRRGLVDGGRFYLARRKWYLTFKNRYSYFPSSTIIRNAAIEADGSMAVYYGGASAGLPKTVKLENVDYQVDYTGEKWASYVLSVADGPFLWSGGRIHLDAGGHDGKTYDYALKLRGDWTDVTIETDLDPGGPLWYSMSAGSASLCRVQTIGSIGVGTKKKPPQKYSDGCAP